mmetsp:Transcript_6970/g.7216  ORF Transcript_6970/g.7216 Transcript_6970/m.7216 type:complete len:299 (+) Transcript_6970:197-1093(+)
MLGAGIGLPLLFVVAISAAVLSYFIQDADAAGDASVGGFVTNNPKPRATQIKTRLTMTNVINKNHHIVGSIDIKPNINSFTAANHYACPPTSVEALRRRYGTNRNLWGEWTCTDTRRFYKQQLPRALQIDGFLGLSLQERARIASEARHALRLYSRERCHLPGRMIAKLLDGVRHVQKFGYWSSSGMSWAEVRLKYELQIRAALGPDATDELVEIYVYKKILDRACETNKCVDELSLNKDKKKKKERKRMIRKDVEVEVEVDNQICEEDDIACTILIDSLYTVVAEERERETNNRHDL